MLDPNLGVSELVCFELRTRNRFPRLVCESLEHTRKNIPAVARLSRPTRPTGSRNHTIRAGAPDDRRAHGISLSLRCERSKALGGPRHLLIVAKGPRVDLSRQVDGAYVVLDQGRSQPPETQHHL